MKPIIFGLILGSALLGANAFAGDYRPEKFDCRNILRPLTEAVDSGQITLNQAEGIWQECLSTYPPN